MTGRPSSFTPEMADTICARLMEGETLRAICRDDEMPSQSMVFRWLREHDAFREQYVLAREVQADTWADEIVEIADDGTQDTKKRADGSETVDAEHIQRSRLRVDTRKWLMSKAAPKKYGDKITSEISGPNGAPIKVQAIEWRVVRPSD